MGALVQFISSGQPVFQVDDWHTILVQNPLVVCFLGKITDQEPPTAPSTLPNGLTVIPQQTRGKSNRWVHLSRFHLGGSTGFHGCHPTLCSCLSHS